MVAGDRDRCLVGRQPDGVVHPEHVAQTGALLPGVEQVADRGDRVATLLEPGDALEPTDVGLVVEPAPTDPGRRVQDLPGLVLADRADRRPGSGGQLLDRHARGSLVDLLGFVHALDNSGRYRYGKYRDRDRRANTPTTAALLATLREVTGRADLEFVAPPTPLSGGFYAEMLRFRLADPPADLDRELVARIVPNPAAGVWEATIQRAVADQGFPTPAVRLTATRPARSAAT